MSTERRELSDSLLQEIVRRVVNVAQPEKIILFGSAARGQLGPNSDVDLLVIKSGADQRKLAMAIYQGLSRVGCAVDVIVATPEDVARYGECPALVYEPALREGRVVYDSSIPAGRSAGVAEPGAQQPRPGKGEK